MHPQLRDAMGQQPADIPVILVHSCSIGVRTEYRVRNNGNVLCMNEGLWKNKQR